MWKNKTLKCQKNSSKINLWISCLILIKIEGKVQWIKTLIKKLRINQIRTHQNTILESD